MSTVYLGFSKRRKFNVISRLIQLIEGTPFSHVYVRIESNWLQRDVIYEASGSYVHFKAKPLWIEQNVVVDEFKLDVQDGEYKTMMQFCMDNAGKSYGLKSLTGFLWVYLGRVLGKRWANPFRDGQATYVCSELGATIAATVNQDEWTDNLEVTPKELYAHMVSRYRK